MSIIPASYAASARLSVAPMMDWTDSLIKVNKINVLIRYAREG